MKTLALALTAAALLAGIAPGAPPTTPSGRPPVGPLERIEPKAYDIAFGAQLIGPLHGEPQPQDFYNLEKAPIVMPIIFLGTYNRVRSESVSARLWLDSNEANPRLELKSDAPYGVTHATLTIEKFNGREIRWSVGYGTQVWSSRIDDEAAARIAWPKEWPKEVMDGLAPQTYIESNDPIFSQAVEDASQGQLRSVPPYLAAKDLIRYCINKIQTTGDPLIRGGFAALQGMNVLGAREAARQGRGTPIDLVSVCVATLRAAGIPARPVIGMEEDVQGKAIFVVWAEFYLPEAGWVPFDPIVMRGKGIRTLDVRKPWPELGTMKDLNRRVPLSYHFIPAASVQSPGWPAVWGWDPRPGNDRTVQYALQLSIKSAKVEP